MFMSVCACVCVCARVWVHVCVCARVCMCAPVRAEYSNFKYVGSVSFQVARCCCVVARDAMVLFYSCGALCYAFCAVPCCVVLSCIVICFAMLHCICTWIRNHICVTAKYKCVCVCFAYYICIHIPFNLANFLCVLVLSLVQVHNASYVFL